MKKFLIALNIVIWSFVGYQATAFAADEAPATKKVCVDAQGKDGKPVIDPKTKKPKQECREVKVHKKHEGTKPEDVKKK
jgi:azurin